MPSILFLDAETDAVRMIVSASAQLGGILTAVNDIGVFRCVVKPWVPSALVWWSVP